MSRNYTIDEAAKLLRVSKRTILREIKRGNLIAQRAGRRYIVSQSQYEKYLGKSQPEGLVGGIESFIFSKGAEMVTLLSRLVSMPSESENQEIVRVAQYLKKRLNKFGVRTVLRGENEFSTVHASFGFKNKGVLLDCPLDTAPIGDISKWKYPPFDGIIKGGRMYGRGALDSKAGIVAMIYALLAIKEYVDESEVRVELVFDGGEHSGAYKGIRDTVTKGLPVKAAVIGYGGSGNNIAIGCRGYHRYKVISHGHSVHTGARYKAGVNAISNMAIFISELEQVKFPRSKYKLFEFGSKVTPAMIEGGRAINIVPDNCELFIDVRTTPDVKRREIERRLSKLIKSLEVRHKGFELSYEYLLGQEGYLLEEQGKIIKSLSQSVFLTKKRKPGIIVHGPSHVGTFLFTKGIPTVVWGPDGGNLHSYDEYVELGSLAKAALVYARCILNYFELF